MTETKKIIRNFATLEYLPPGSMVCLFGAGEGGSISKKILEEYNRNFKIIYFIDSHKKGQKDGIEIISPQELKKSNSKCDMILITSERYEEIEKVLESLNIKDYMIFNSAAFKGCIYTEDEKRKNENLFEKVKGILHHKRDRELFDLIIDQRSIKSRRRTDFLRHVMPVEKQYLDFINTNCIKTIIEGGVSNGQNTYDFSKFPGKDLHIYGFEPSLDALKNGRYYPLLKNNRNIQMFPLALWKYKTTLRLFDDGTRSKIIETMQEEKAGNIQNVDAVSIDEFVDEKKIQKVDFIKMDIEGSEMEALNGAIKTLSAHRPQLAISIYHGKKHLYEIPLFLDSVLENYIYKLGHYHPHYVETILYAIPEEIYEESDINRFELQFH